jgi:hypothetical protein
MRKLFLVGLIVWIALIGGAVAGKKTFQSPSFARKATVVDSSHSAISPDGKNSVSLRWLDENGGDFSSQVTVHTPAGIFREKINFGLDAEVLWSEDSKAFSITGSAEGANGQYHTDAFYIRSGQLDHISLTDLIQQAFGHPVKCGWSEVPNVAALKWMDGSTKLLLAAEIIHHSNCDSYGTFAGFVVDVSSQRIVGHYNQLEMKRLFRSDLGPELQQANDACILQPRSCYVAANHPESDNAHSKK